MSGKNTKSKASQQKNAKVRKPWDRPWKITLEGEAQASRPIDYSFAKMKQLTAWPPEDARVNRLGLLAKGPTERLVSRSLWLNHNRITSLENIQDMVNSTMEFPNLLGFLDLSCNCLKEIHSDLFRFPNISVLYLHGNKLNDPRDIFKLRQLKKLQHLTIYANPWCSRAELGNMRQLVAAYLPNLAKLDHNRFTGLERSSPLAAYAWKILRELTGEPDDWLFRKFPIPVLTPEIQKSCDPQTLKRIGKYFADDDVNGETKEAPNESDNK